MSFLPYVLRDMTRSLRMLENHFRHTDELFHPLSTPFFITRRPWELEQSDSIIQDKDKFQVKLDVQDFKPEEIIVKTLDGNSIQIEAKHEEKGKDNSFVSKQFVRKFVLPQGHELKDVVSSLSSDGVLTVTAPRKANAELDEKVIPVAHIEGNKKSE